MALQHKVFFGQCYQLFSPAMLEYFQENNWDPMFSISLADMENATTCAAACSALAAQLYDAGFEFWVDIEDGMNTYDNPSVTRDTTIAWYESNYGASMNYIEALPGLKGIYTEATFNLDHQQQAHPLV